MRIIEELNANAGEHDDAEYGVNHLTDVDPSEFLMKVTSGENHVCCRLTHRDEQDSCARARPMLTQSRHSHAHAYARACNAKGFAHAPMHARARTRTHNTPTYIHILTHDTFSHMTDTHTCLCLQCRETHPRAHTPP